MEDLMKIKIIRFSEAATLPKRAHYNDAGADVYCPHDILIRPGDTVAVGLGFGVEIPDGFMGLIYVRSSMVQDGLTVDLPPIDAGYRGEIHALITNRSDNGHVILKKGDRIGQLVIQPVIYVEANAPGIAGAVHAAEDDI